MMSAMIERVARKLEPQAWAALGIGDTLAYSNRRKSSLRKARLVIEALREPTEGIAEIMNRHASNGMVDWRDLHAAVIDAALA